MAGKGIQRHVCDVCVFCCVVLSLRHASGQCVIVQYSLLSYLRAWKVPYRGFSSLGIVATMDFSCRTRPRYDSSATA